MPLTFIFVTGFGRVNYASSMFSQQNTFFEISNVVTPDAMWRQTNLGVSLSHYILIVLKIHT